MECNYRHALEMDDIPVLDPSALTMEVRARIEQGWRIAALFGLPESETPDDRDPLVGVFCVLAQDSTGTLAMLRTPPLRRYPALTPACPQAHLFEREIFEQWNILPEGHPWLKPVRFVPPLARPDGPRSMPGDMTYFRVDGPAVHEVAVGPVHAGVIEPGHFRFQCYGENVLHLEISLGFQHRGVERALRHGPDARTIHLMECLAGDSSIAHATAHCALLETLTDHPVPPRGQALRRIALELERLACHTGDLGAMGGDVGFLPTSAWCGRIRGDFLNMTALLCGNRFGRGMVRPGGVAYDVDETLCRTMSDRLKAAWRDISGAVDIMLDDPGVLARFEGTGALAARTAREIGMVGVAAKACGLALDARFQYPLSGLPETQATLRTCDSGDVHARALVRRQEVDDSVRIIERELMGLRGSSPAADGSWEEPSLAGTCRRPDLPALPPRRVAAAFVEGWRGMICHVGITGAQGTFRAYKVVDPSFHNWFGLALALRGGQISDFPLCNKSFNLSYCGHDL